MGAAGFVLPFIGAIVAIVLAYDYEARAQIRWTREDGAELALAGLILGYVNLAVLCIGVVLVVILLSSNTAPGQGPFGQ